MNDAYDIPSASRREATRRRYSKGTRVKLLQELEDPYAPLAAGTKGTVVSVDDMCQIHVDWDNGRGLALVPGTDSFEVLERPTPKHNRAGDAR